MYLKKKGFCLELRSAGRFAAIPMGSACSCARIYNSAQNFIFTATGILATNVRKRQGHTLEVVLAVRLSGPLMIRPSWRGELRVRVWATAGRWPGDFPNYRLGAAGD